MITRANIPLDLPGTVWTNGGMDDPQPSIHEVAGLAPAALRACYEQLLGCTPPPKASPDFLRGDIAWALQAQCRGKDPVSLRRGLLKAVCRPKGGKLTYKAGTRLIREWHGQTYEVTILDTGFLWQGRTYRSLSEIARAITGSHCSGPRFFGLK